MFTSLLKLTIAVFAAVLGSLIILYFLSSYRAELHLMEKKLFGMAAVIGWANITALLILYATGLWRRTMTDRSGAFYMLIGYVLYYADVGLRIPTRILEFVFVIYYLYELIF